jgi:hypothetical protein
MSEVKQLTDYELRVLRHVAGYKVTPDVIPGAALWQCIERLKGHGYVGCIVMNDLTREWHLTDLGRGIIEGVWKA